MIIQHLKNARLRIIDIVLLYTSLSLLGQTSREMNHAHTDGMTIAMLPTTTRSREERHFEMMVFTQIIRSALSLLVVEEDCHRDGAGMDTLALVCRRYLLPAMPASFIEEFGNIPARNRAEAIAVIDLVQSTLAFEILRIGLGQLGNDGLAVIAAFCGSDFYFHGEVLYENFGATGGIRTHVNYSPPAWKAGALTPELRSHIQNHSFGAGIRSRTGVFAQAMRRFTN